MMKKTMQQMMMAAIALAFLCVLGMPVHATEAEQPAAEEAASSLSFEIGTFTYDILPNASQEDMPSLLFSPGTLIPFF